MLRLLIVVVAIVVALLAFSALGGRRPARRDGGGAVTFPYRQRKALFTPAERSFLGVLEREVGDRYRVFGKVRLVDLLEVVGAVSQSERRAAFNRITQKHVDFLLCRPDDLTVVAAIELDDASHARSDRQQRDGFLAAACRAAGLKLLRFEAKAAYTTAEVRAALVTLEDAIEVSARGASR